MDFRELPDGEQGRGPSGRPGAGLPEGVSRLPLGRAWTILEPLLAALRSRHPSTAVLPAGSIRRFEPLIDDLQVIVVSDAPSSVFDSLRNQPNVEHVADVDESAVSIVIAQDDVLVRVVAPAALATTLLHRTGPERHVRHLRSHAARRGLTLTESALVDARGESLACAAEEDVYRALGLDFVPPELRDDGREVLAAANGGIPRLVGTPDLRGDLHMHSTWSDGHDSIEDMTRAARDLGYEYVAITDHSRSSLASRSLEPEDLRRQADEVAAVRERVTGITLLHGIEVDILSDGRLDFPDGALEPLDLVLASLHHALGQSGRQLTERYLAAIRHPLVSVVTHLTNRLVGRREGYDLDLDRIFEAAAATHTALEVDGAPVHLDLDGALARRAVAAGVMLTVDSDAHRTEALRRNIGFGVGMARRGWVEPAHVLNTRPLDEVCAFFRARR